MPIATIAWVEGKVRLVDQTKLPLELEYIECETPEQIWEAIKVLRIRGAPAIGIAAAFGVVLGIADYQGTDYQDFKKHLDQVADYLATSRPTAVNLFWALDRMRAAAEAHRELPIPALKKRLLQEAQTILREDQRICRAIGRYGAALIRDGMGILTHCNAGGMATADYGTALAILFSAHEQGKRIHVVADETRPLLQGARITTWELMQAHIDVTLICDNMAAQVMREGRVQCVIVGADRIAANGDTANKIGTYGLSILARYHGIPFYVAAPTSTIDASLASGAQIPIEIRDEKEVTEPFGRRTAPPGVSVYNPAFDVTPAELIDAIVTEQGIIVPPFEENVPSVLAKAGVL